MDHLCGFTFAPFALKGVLGNEASRASLRAMVERTHANFVIFVPPALQDTPQSETMTYAAGNLVADEELEEMIHYAQDLNLMVALKPTVNCRNGTWRAHINFFDEDVPCEPKWHNWFKSYTDFQLHYATIAEKTHCDMFIAGCEMVMSERRDQEWRKLIRDIRTVYTGPVSYNTDKYQEHRVTWWDEVDIISSSGYYPLEDWENQLDRIEKVVLKFNKPFFFAETGCMSIAGSSNIPNDWTLKGDYAPEEQAAWFQAMLSACEKRDWVGGTAIWSWTGKLYSKGEQDKVHSYDVYLKSAESVIRSYYLHKKEKNTY